MRVRDPAGAERDEPADLVVACDGVRSPVRAMAGIEAEITLAEGAHLSFMSPAVIDRSFALHYQADGRQVGLLGWPDGLGRLVGHRALRARRGPRPRPRRLPRRLHPAASPRPLRRVEALTSVDQLVYREVEEVRCERWWVPGLVVIGDAAHAVGPEAGLGAGLGLGDALALAIAVEQSPRRRRRLRRLRALAPPGGAPLRGDRRRRRAGRARRRQAPRGALAAGRRPAYGRFTRKETTPLTVWPSTPVTLQFTR